ncbi:MAG TPA: GNAT family N-acetyltransferase [Blastocatellia bacterium]|nr:GNAT family N-acetyltransferase [Blastocatellia bacterium]
MITVEKITSAEGFRELKPVWNPLLAQSESDTISLTWEWLTAWWAVFSTGRQLNILVVRDGQEVIALAPLIHRTVQHYGLLPFRRLELLASGEDEDDEICSEYLDFILRRGRETEAMEAIVDFLRNQDDWDELLLKNLSGSSPALLRLLTWPEELLANGQVPDSKPGVFIPLPASHSQFLDGISKSLRREIRKARRTAASQGYQFRVIDGVDGFEESFELLIGIHQSRWSARGKPGVFASPKFLKFHRLLAPKLIENGWLKLFVLRIAGKPVAALYAFTYGNKVHLYQSGFLSGQSSVANPGTLIRDFAIEWAIGAGYKEWDFLKAEAGSYKFRWSGNTREIVNFRLAQPRSKELIYATTTRVMDGLRHIRRAFR